MIKNIYEHTQTHSVCWCVWVVCLFMQYIFCLHETKNLCQHQQHWATKGLPSSAILDIRTITQQLFSLFEISLGI